MFAVHGILTDIPSEQSRRIGVLNWRPLVASVTTCVLDSEAEFMLVVYLLFDIPSWVRINALQNF